MKKIIMILLSCVLLAGCTGGDKKPSTDAKEETVTLDVKGQEVADLMKPFSYFDHEFSVEYNGKTRELNYWYYFGQDELKGQDVRDEMKLITCFYEVCGTLASRNYEGTSVTLADLNEKSMKIFGNEIDMSKIDLDEYKCTNYHPDSETLTYDETTHSFTSEPGGHGGGNHNQGQYYTTASKTEYTKHGEVVSGEIKVGVKVAYFKVINEYVSGYGVVASDPMFSYEMDDFEDETTYDISKIYDDLDEFEFTFVLDDNGNYILESIVKLDNPNHKTEYVEPEKQDQNQDGITQLATNSDEVFNLMDPFRTLNNIQSIENINVPNQYFYDYFYAQNTLGYDEVDANVKFIMALYDDIYFRAKAYEPYTFTMDDINPVIEKIFGSPIDVEDLEYNHNTGEVAHYPLGAPITYDQSTKQFTMNMVGKCISGSGLDETIIEATKKVTTINNKKTTTIKVKEKVAYVECIERANVTYNIYSDSMYTNRIGSEEGGYTINSYVDKLPTYQWTFIDQGDGYRFDSVELVK